MKIPEWLQNAVDWVPKRVYLELFGETEEAVRKRIHIGAWKAGEQYSRPEGAGMWISIKGVNAWAAKHTEKRGATPE